MKPLTTCPGCQAPLIRKTIPEHLNCLKYENCSERCVVDYFQYYDKSYDEPELKYIHYNTPDNVFSVISHFDNDFYSFKNVSYIYSNATTKKYGFSSPILTLPMDKYPLDVTDIKAVHQKISVLSTFV